MKWDPVGCRLCVRSRKSAMLQKTVELQRRKWLGCYSGGIRGLLISDCEGTCLTWIAVDPEVRRPRWFVCWCVSVCVNKRMGETGEGGPYRCVFWYVQCSERQPTFSIIFDLLYTVYIGQRWAGSVQVSRNHSLLSLEAWLLDDSVSDVALLELFLDHNHCFSRTFVKTDQLHSCEVIAAWLVLMEHHN